MRSGSTRRRSTTLNHCFLTRAELAAAVPGAVIPRDGETVEV